MPTTRKKVVKTIYKDDEESEVETGDFSDSGSDAKISDQSSSEEEEVEFGDSSGNEFDEKSKNRSKKSTATKKSRRPKFAKSFLNKIKKQTTVCGDNDNVNETPALFSVKDLTDADKLLPSILNLSESDSSDDECPKVAIKKIIPEITNTQNDSSSDNEDVEYKDVFSKNLRDNSEEIAKNAFMVLEQHKTKIEETKASVQSYNCTSKTEKESDIKDLLALGEEVIPPPTQIKQKKSRKIKADSDSEVEDWEEVKESKAVPQQGIQLFVAFPDAACKKKKKLDVEMMMKRKINRVKKEYQVYMHKVHVLCWLGHGNYISRVLNDQEIMAAALSLVPSKECYPGERVDMKYVEQITSWYKDKLILMLDKNEDKFRPKAPPLKDILLTQIKTKKVTARKYLVFVFVSMLRALGLKCRVMFNFVTLPLKPPTSELCSLSTKPNDLKSEDKSNTDKESIEKKNKKSCKNNKAKVKISQVDGHDDSDLDNIMQVDGNNDALSVKTRTTRAKSKTVKENSTALEDGEVSPPKRLRKSPKKGMSVTEPEKHESQSELSQKENIESTPKLSLRRQQKPLNKDNLVIPTDKTVKKQSNPSRTRSKSDKNTINTERKTDNKDTKNQTEDIKKKLNPPKIIVTGEKKKQISSKYFEENNSTAEHNKHDITRKRSRTANSKQLQGSEDEQKNSKAKPRTRSAPSNNVEKSQYFADGNEAKKPRLNIRKKKSTDGPKEDNLRVSHRDLVKSKAKPKKDVKEDLVSIIKNRVKEAKVDSKRGIVKGKIKEELDEDSDYLPEEEPNRRKSESDDDFKPLPKLSPRPSTSKKIDRRVLSSDDETLKNKVDVWCEIYVEELEQWISVDVIRGKIYAHNDTYTHATHPVCYVIGWDNNNYIKDLTRRYVPQWNTVTRKLRAEPDWWQTSIQPWLGPKTARDKEEDESLDRMQLEAPLPKSIAEYKNHPLYALKRHLLKFEAIYPPDSSTLGFVRGEAVYARECVYTCRSRDTWLKEAKVVGLGEKPYKIVKARPKWDKLSNKLITDKPLEVFGPWQVQDYEPPVAENGIVPRNAYGNVELFKDCMLPKGTVHIKLPGLNKVARKLNIDCAPAMTGFDFNGGWSHPVYDGFVVCKEFEEIVTEAWVTDQEEQERREIEKTEARVYGNWRRLIKGLFIRERLKHKYGFEEPSTSQASNKTKGPRLAVKKKY